MTFALNASGITANVHVFERIVIDNDGDGFTSYIDCDDNDPDIYPGAEEICDNGIDDNCNGEVDEGCPLKIGDIHEGGIFFI